MDKNLSNKYGQKLPDSDKKFKTDAIKTASKRAIQKTAEATDDLIGNKIADKITSPSTKKGPVWRRYQKDDTYHQKKDSKLLMN